jgi:hypothetical protein
MARKAMATNGNELKKLMDNKGNEIWATVVDPINEKFCERQIYVDDEGSEYVALGNFYLDTYLLSETFGLRFDKYEKDPWW